LAKRYAEISKGPRYRWVEKARAEELTLGKVG